MTKFEKVQTTIAVIQVIVVVGSVYFVVQQISQAQDQLELSALSHQTAIEMDRRARAMDFIKRFNTEPIITIRSNAAGAIMNNEIDAHPGRHDLQAYLNFYEEMALAVENNLAHEEICKLFFRSPMTFLCNACKGFLDANPNTYSHVKGLLQKWKSIPPTIAPLPTSP
jgi:hypothetical protein